MIANASPPVPLVAHRAGTPHSPGSPDLSLSMPTRRLSFPSHARRLSFSPHAPRLSFSPRAPDQPEVGSQLHDPATPSQSGRADNDRAGEGLSPWQAPGSSPPVDADKLSSPAPSPSPTPRRTLASLLRVNGQASFEKSPISGTNVVKDQPNPATPTRSASPASATGKSSAQPKRKAVTRDTEHQASGSDDDNDGERPTKRLRGVSAGKGKRGVKHRDPGPSPESEDKDEQLPSPESEGEQSPSPESEGEQSPSPRKTRSGKGKSVARVPAVQRKAAPKRKRADSTSGAKGTLEKKSKPAAKKPAKKPAPPATPLKRPQRPAAANNKHIKPRKE